MVEGISCHVQSQLALLSGAALEALLSQGCMVSKLACSSQSFITELCGVPSMHLCLSLASLEVEELSGTGTLRIRADQEDFQTCLSGRADSSNIPCQLFQMSSFLHCPAGIRYTHNK